MASQQQDVSCINRIRYHLANVYQGNCTLENLEKIESQLEMENVQIYIESAPQSFSICKHTHDNWDIKLKVNVKLCEQYLNGQCHGNCCMLHVCKYFLIGDKFCQSPCKFGFSHNITDKHNNKIWKSLSPDLYTIPPNLKLRILRNSFPRVCPNIKRGKDCCDLFCGKLHVCSKYLFGCCTSGAVCQLSKSSGLSKLHDLSTRHNTAVLSSFDLSCRKNDRNMLLSNILLTKINFKESDTTSQTKKPLVFCHFYLNAKCTETCGKLHICKEYLVNKCHDICVFGFSHNFLDDHNQAVMVTQGIQNYTYVELFIVIQNSFPWLCKDYLLLKTCNESKCKEMHICHQFTNNNCSTINCPFSHDFKNVHNLKVLQHFSLDKVEDVRTNILYSKFGEPSLLPMPMPMPMSMPMPMPMPIPMPMPMPMPMPIPMPLMDVKCNQNKIREETISSNNNGRLYKDQVKEKQRMFKEKKSSRDSSQKKKSCNEQRTNNQVPHLSKDDNSMKIIDGNLEICTLKNSVEKSDDQLLSFDNECIKVEEKPVLSCVMQENSIEEKPLIPCLINVQSEELSANLGINTQEMASVRVKNTISEIDIFQFVTRFSSNGSYSCLLNDLLHFFDGDASKAEKWFRDNHPTFRLVRSISHEITVHICLGEVKLCTFYWKNDGCSRKCCPMFHICKKLLLNIDHSSVSCTKNHDINTQENLIHEHNLTFLTDDQLLRLLQYRYPFICMKYLDKDCQLTDEFCPDVHICYEFVKGKCKKQDGLCEYKHEEGLHGKQALRLTKEFHLDKRSFQYCIMLPERKACFTDCTKNSFKAEFNSLKNEAICYQYVTNNCIDGLNCHLIHADSSYLWQYRTFSGAWKSLPRDDNKEIEKIFCDPRNNDYNSTNICVTFDNLKHNFEGKYEKTTTTFRRLSTKSSVHNPTGDEGLTEWKWYWNTHGEGWEEYCDSTSSQDVEINFLNNPIDTPMIFELNYRAYVLLFSTMKQENLDKVGSTRLIRRRPVFKEIVTQTNTSHKSIIPLYWPLHSKGERIVVSEPLYSSIKMNFIKSIGMAVRVLKIEEVCNEEYYMKYDAKKKIMSEKCTTTFERSLYHGTSANVLDGICAINFDFRVCGKNGTAYGLGSYFAVNADYSHRYTGNVDASGIRYMFLADVLVGHYTMGSSVLKRPPAVSIDNPHVLYDSVVDHTQQPSIFVIFERDQCYPRYLISYKTVERLSSYASSAPSTSYKPNSYSQQQPTADKCTVS